MTAHGLLQIAVYLAVLLALVKPLGLYMARVYEGKPCGLDSVFRGLERGMSRLCGVRPEADMTWRGYALAALVFNIAGLLAVYLIQRVQHLLPLTPADLPAVAPDSAFNTAV